MTTIDHVTVIVADAEAAAAKLAEVVGAEVLRIADSATLVVRTIDLSGVELHLVEFRSVEAASSAPPLGLHHVALRVPDLADALADFEAAGIPAQGAPVETAPGVREVFVDSASAGGVPLQLVERRQVDAAGVFDAAAVAALAEQGSSLAQPGVSEKSS
jgi:methylmalonyl-CoA/ethylmalonyl-CoA epimerase